jgi:trehalose 6-phosphate phosphatase
MERRRISSTSLRVPRTAPRPTPPPLVADASAVFLDIDGTLLHLASTPDGVHVDSVVVALLPALARRLQGALALITGRTLADADRLFPGLSLPAAGQHGLERRAANGSVHTHPAPLDLGPLRGELATFARRHPGLLFEDKGSTFALHYRLAPRLASHVHRVVRSRVASAGGAAFRLQPGKAMVDIGPKGRTKGTAIQEYMTEPPFRGRMPVFVGDDRSDENGFAAVRVMGGWGVKVGSGPTVASYRLRDVAAVRHWLGAAIGAASQATYQTTRDSIRDA